MIDNDITDCHIDRSASSFSHRARLLAMRIHAKPWHPQQFVAPLSQVKDLLPNLFVFGKLAVFLLAQAINRREIDGLSGCDFWICRYAAFNAEGFLSFVRSGPAMKQPRRVRVRRIFKHRRRADQTDTERAQVIELRAFMHVTTRETIAEIDKAKAEGLTVYSEIGTHYLVLHKDAWKINVPLRDRATHETLWQALASGAIDCIGSDHVAHTRTRESMETGNVWTTISGFPSRIEGMLPMMLSEGVNKGRITMERLAQVASENPARIFGLYPKKGAILPGADADLIVVDLKRRAKITKELLHTITPWSIYEGSEVTGWPVMTSVLAAIQR